VAATCVRMEGGGIVGAVGGSGAGAAPLRRGEVGHAGQL
jgi:hypothetical protein